MPKYYVSSGNLRFVGHATNEVQAIQKAITKCKSQKTLGRVIVVNEQGFRRLHKRDVFFDTIMFLENLV